jgi:type II secretory pathway component PulC
MSVSEEKMNQLHILKNLIVSFTLTFCVYCGLFPLAMLQQSSVTTFIEDAQPNISMSLDEADINALHSEPQGTDEKTEKGNDKVDSDGEIATNKPNSSSKETVNTSLVRKDGVPPKNEPVTEKTKKTKDKKTRKCKPDNPEIVKVNSRKYLLPKKLIRYYGSNWGKANALAYLGWSKNKEGNVQGVKIRHISCKSPLSFTGLRRGDIITSVNGKPVTSQAKLMRLYAQLFRWKKIELNIIRRGRPIKIRYTVVA